MGLDQPGNDETARAIADGNLFRGTVRLTARPPDRLYPPRPHDHVGPHHPPAALVQQGVAAREHQVRRGSQHGGQVVIRGCALLVSSGRSK